MNENELLKSVPERSYFAYVNGQSNILLKTKAMPIKIFRWSIWFFVVNTVTKRSMIEVQYQNKIFDAYNVLVTSIGLMIAVFFYSKISFFLEYRRLEMETKYRDIRSDRLEGKYIRMSQYFSSILTILI